MTPRRAITRSIPIALILALVAAIAAWAAPGDLDPTFSTDGFTVTTFADRYGVATSVALQSNDKVVAVGSMHRNATVQTDFALTRYTRSGRLDALFDGDGRVLTDFDGRFDEARGVAVQPDDKIVVVGSSSDDIAIARYFGDGRLDPTFSGDGKQLIDLGGFEAAADVGVQPNGKLLVVGTDGADFLVIRLRAGGKLDQTFGDGGVVTTDFAGSQDAARAVAVSADFKIVVGGSAFVDPDDSTDFAVVRFGRTGRPDPSFGGDGLVWTDFLGFEDMITDLVLQPNGRIVTSGQANEFPGTADQSSDVGLARYETDGDLDVTFGDGGTVRTDFGSFFDQAEGMALQPDGKIVVASHLFTATSHTSAVARYEADGDLDPTFGDNGIADSGVEVSGDEVGGLARQADGRIVVSTGATTSDPERSFGFLVLRYLAT